jgi:hypothetical protein
VNICQVFMLICEFAELSGAAPLNYHADCWEAEIDDKWKIAVNAHNDPRPTTYGYPVPPISAFLQYNGWPAGIVTPTGGYMAAGDAANEDALITALNQRIAAIKRDEEAQ